MLLTFHCCCLKKAGLVGERDVLYKPLLRCCCRIGSGQQLQMLPFVSGAYLTARHVCLVYGSLSPCLGFLSPSGTSWSQGLWGSKSSHAAVPTKLARGLCASLFGGKHPTRDELTNPSGFLNPFQILLHSASFINWIVFLSSLLSKSN